MLMKKLSMLCILALFMNPIFSQENTETWSKSFGVMLVPQGGIDLKNTKAGLSNQSNIFFIGNFTKGKNTFIPFYSVTNALGMAYSRSFSENYGMYAVTNKNVLVDGGYFGIGATRKVGNASLFIETGTQWNTWSPGFNIGVFIPFTFKI